VARQRAKRPVDLSANAALPVSSEPLSGPRGPQAAVDPAIAKTLVAQAERLEALEKQGFNPYQARIEPAAAARSALVLEQQPNGSNVNSNARAETETVDLDDADQMTRARSDLVLAMHSGADKEVLRRALVKARRFDVPEVEEATELLAALDIEASPSPMPSSEDLDAIEDVNNTWALLVHAQESKETLTNAIKTLDKLCSNLLENPQEAKFRTIRLENKTISANIVTPADGAALNVLAAVGFERVDDVMSVPDPSSLPPNVVAAARGRLQRVIELCNAWLNDARG